MKKALIFYISFLIISGSSFAQNSENCSMHHLIIGGNHNFQIVGEDSKTFIDSLFAHYPKTKRKGYIWKFKNVAVPGIEEPVTLQVHQGLYGEHLEHAKDSTKCKNGHYFTTFTSERYKQQRLDNKKSNEQDAVTIYIKEGRNYGISNVEDAKIVKAFLISFYES